LTDRLTTQWWTGIDGVPAVGGRSEHVGSGRSNVTHSDVAIIGAGFGGLGAAIRLKQSGIDDFVVFDKAGDVVALVACAVPALEPTDQAQHAYSQRIERMSATVWMTGRESWYLDATGRNSTLWQGYVMGFKLRLRQFGRNDYAVVHPSPPLTALGSQPSPGHLKAPAPSRDHHGGDPVSTSGAAAAVHEDAAPGRNTTV
jgi:hypothetical protein